MNINSLGHFLEWLTQICLLEAHLFVHCHLCRNHNRRQISFRPVWTGGEFTETNISQFKCGHMVHYLKTWKMLAYSLKFGKAISEVSRAQSWVMEWVKFVCFTVRRFTEGTAQLSYRYWTVNEPPRAADTFVSNISTKRQDETFLSLCRNTKRKVAVDFHFFRPSHGRHEQHRSVESLGDMCGSLGGWPTFAPFFGLLERSCESRCWAHSL